MDHKVGSTTFDQLVAPLWSTWNHELAETSRLAQDDGNNQDARRLWFKTLTERVDRQLRSTEFVKYFGQVVDSLIQGRLRGDSSGLTELSQQVRRWQDRLAQHTEGLAPDLPACRAGVTPHEVVYQRGGLRLLRYRGGGGRIAEPIVICFALINRPYVLDLLPERSVVQALVQAGFDVYLIDWGAPSTSENSLRLHDYVCDRLLGVVDHVRQETGAPQVNLLGYCMGGVLATLFTTLYPDRVRNLILMATPIDFQGDESLLQVWTQPEHFDVDRFVDAFGNCPGEFLQAGFLLTQPVRNFAEKPLTFLQRQQDKSYLQTFAALEQWANHAIPVAGETFREYVKKLYQRNELIRGELQLNGAPIDLADMKRPLLLLVAKQDHLTPPASSLALLDRVGSSQKKTIQIDTGHIGLAVSGLAHRRLWPQAVEWIASHSTPHAQV